MQAIDLLAEHGPGLGRPLVDTIHGSSMANLKELRPGTATSSTSRTGHERRGRHERLLPVAGHPRRPRRPGRRGRGGRCG
ncbi:type II toxin-antitoxin system RelE/ParE family toxin [Micromonospora aurantiaca]